QDQAARVTPVGIRSLVHERISYLALGIGLVLLSAGLVLTWRVSHTFGGDFDHFYVVAKTLASGFDLYATTDLGSVYRQFDESDAHIPWGIFNNPSVGVAILPLIILPVEAARSVWFLLSVGVLLVGVYQLMRLFAPSWTLGVRIAVLGTLMCTSAARWGFYYLQPAPLIFGLLCLYLVALNRKRSVLAGVAAAFVLCLKATLALPFIALALLQRRYALAGCVLAIWVLANGLGFLRMGGIDALHGYQSNMALFQQADQLNYPDFRAPNSMQQLDWPYLLNAVDPNLTRSDWLAKVLTGVSLLILMWQWLRCRALAEPVETARVFLGPLVCLCLLSVYHHHYDAIVLFGPVIGYLSTPGRHAKQLIVLFVVPVMVFAGLYQVEESQVLLDRAFGDGASLIMKLLGVICVNLAFVASLLLLNEFVCARAGPLPLSRAPGKRLISLAARRLSTCAASARHLTAPRTLWP
ncbi:MAG: DUF2029 domain-containing protein, partial [Chloroflexi bacterium]|nr:DUF2029 domain-containing protein [Chloroflexota bacterium]